MKKIIIITISVIVLSFVGCREKPKKKLAEPFAQFKEKLMENSKDSLANLVIKLMISNGQLMMQKQTTLEHVDEYKQQLEEKNIDYNDYEEDYW